jgi:hypothetical protein
VKLFDSRNPVVRAFLHVSYAFAITLLVLMVREMVHNGGMPVRASIRRLLAPDDLLSLGIGTLLVALLLYLHLPKMIDRCFTIGRKFGL